MIYCYGRVARAGSGRTIEQVFWRSSACWPQSLAPTRRTSLGKYTGRSSTSRVSRSKISKPPRSGCAPCVHTSRPDLTKFYAEHVAFRDCFEILAICNTAQEQALSIEAFEAFEAFDARAAPIVD